MTSSTKCLFDNDKFHISLLDKMIKIFIPFRGKDKKCHECGGNRELIIRLDFNGKLIEFDECCDKPMEFINQ